MKFSQLSYLAVLACSQLAAADGEVHGEGVVGTKMGPVAFLWPDDRNWSATADNTAPCGSTDGVVNRTDFPLTQGTVALSIGEDATNVKFSIAYDNNPTVQSQFTQQVVSDPMEIEPGHKCYRVADIPDTVAVGSNATIQLQYFSHMDDELGGQDQTFYACADITFVEKLEKAAPCFNVSTSDFNMPSSSSSIPAPTATDAGSDTMVATNAPAPAASSDDMSAGAKAGIAVGVIVASLAIVGAVAFAVLRRRRSRPADHETQIPTSKFQPEVASVNSHPH
ncbi:hypothetical protein GGS26DRAFT_539095 [Hypomontagnella submonticulosa]|nr:hypothetical protein GGS26DRAFT_539095 [Hypomontagnella submonticulosa]